MKPLKKHYTYIYFLYLPLFLLALALVLFFPEQSLLCFRVHWLILLFTLFLALSPIGKIRLGEKSTKIKFPKWFGIIFSAGIALTFIYWGLMYVCFQGLPVLIPSHHSQYISNTGSTLLLTWGFYPWFVFLLIGIGLAYIGFYQKKPGKFSLLLSIIFKSHPDDATSLSVDFITRTIAHFSLATSIGIVTLLTIALLSKLTQSPILVGLNFVTVIVVTILFIGINTRQWQKIVRYFAVRKIPLAILSILFIFTAAIIILLVNYLITMFVANFPQGNKTLINFQIPHWELHWQLLSGMWWLGWIPLMSGLIAFFPKAIKFAP